MKNGIWTEKSGLGQSRERGGWESWVSGLAGEWVSGWVYTNGGYLQAAIAVEHREKRKGVGGFVVPESGLRYLLKDKEWVENSLRVSLWIKMLDV